MRSILQRVTKARVSVNSETCAEIGPGLLVLLGVSADDNEADAALLAEKTVKLRIFDDSVGKMNRSLIETDGSLLVVSQFTLLGDAHRGRRPSFIRAAPPEMANRLYEYFIAEARKQVAHVVSGRFREMMEVELVNSGPVTIILDSKNTF